MAVLLREAIGDSIRRARTERRRTLRDVSGAARVSLGYLSEIERGRKEPSSELLAAICEALAMTLPDLLDDAADAMRPGRRRSVVDSALRSAVEEAFGVTGEEDVATAEDGERPAPSGDGARAHATGFQASATDPTVGPDALADGPGADGAAAGELAGGVADAPGEELADPGAPGTVRLVARLSVPTDDRGLVAAA